MSETSSPSMQDVFEQNMALWQQTQTQFADWMQDSFQSASATHQSPDPTPLFSQMVGTDALFGADRKALAFMDAIMKLASTGSELNGVMAQAWVEAYQRYSTSDARTEEPVGMMATMNSWFNYANDALLHCQRTHEFLEAQRNYVNASTECRNRFRELMEVFQEQHQMPTRSEVDDLSHTVYELRKEVRALKRQLKKAEISATAPTVTAPGHSEKTERAA
ncbi:MAG: poly(R)-hydroxyalkanoic acid synthase subunit PhaE [Pseudomonadota bacterium]